MIKVHHFKQGSQGHYLSIEAAIKAWQQGEYQLVALLDSRYLEAAYLNTIHIDRKWWKNDCVTLVKQSRSSQVGDIFEQNNELHIIRSRGFEKIDCPVSIPVQSVNELKRSA